MFLEVRIWVGVDGSAPCLQFHASLGHASWTSNLLPRQDGNIRRSRARTVWRAMTGRISPFPDCQSRRNRKQETTCPVFYWWLANIKDRPL